MDLHIIIILAGALVFLAHFFSWLFSFTKIPGVLWLMLIGLLLGPVFGILTPDFFGEAGQLGVMIALAIIFFEGGMKLRLDALLKSWKSTTLLSVISFFVSAALVGTAVLFLTDLHPILAFALGAIVGDQAAALVVPLLEGLPVRPESRTSLILESGLSDVLSVVLALALLRAYEIGTFHIEQVLMDMMVYLVGSTLLGVGFALVWSVLLNRVRHIHHSIFVTPAFVFILFGIAEAADLSGLVAAIAFGVTLGNIPLFQRYLETRHGVLNVILHPLSLNTHEKTFISEIAFVVETFFYVFIGISITFASTSTILLSLVLVVGIFFARTLVVRYTISSETSASDASIIASMIPRGLATAVLGSIALQKGFEGGLLMQEITYTVVLWSIIVTSVLIFLFQKTPLSKVHEWYASRNAISPSKFIE